MFILVYLNTQLLSSFFFPSSIVNDESVVRVFLFPEKANHLSLNFIDLHLLVFKVKSRFLFLPQGHEAFHQTVLQFYLKFW